MAAGTTKTNPLQNWGGSVKQAAPPAWSMPTQPKGKAVSSFKVTKKLQLLLEQMPIRTRAGQLVGVQVGYGEKALQSQVKAAGGVSGPGPASRLWKLPQRTARRQGLSDRERALKE
jgi:hypothetical protein